MAEPPRDLVVAPVPLGRRQEAAPDVLVTPSRLREPADAMMDAPSPTRRQTWRASPERSRSTTCWRMHPGACGAGASVRRSRALITTFVGTRGRLAGEVLTLGTEVSR
jgi:hypothetical protein